ncbi:MAG: hypothetical protein MUF48_03265 [Pirellulaceae bacterium]|nr:hypothetical protein [Pirellulaceae bacterium]
MRYLLLSHTNEGAGRRRGGAEPRKQLGPQRKTTCQRHHYDEIQPGLQGTARGVYLPFTFVGPARAGADPAARVDAFTVP